MGLCKTIAAACDERSAVSAVEVVDDSACDKDDKPPASRSVWRYCSSPSSADFAERRVSPLAVILENYLHETKYCKLTFTVRQISRGHRFHFYLFISRSTI